MYGIFQLQRKMRHTRITREFCSSLSSLLEWIWVGDGGLRAVGLIVGSRDVVSEVTSSTSASPGPGRERGGRGGSRIMGDLYSTNHPSAGVFQAR